MKLLKKIIFYAFGLIISFDISAADREESIFEFEPNERSSLSSSAYIGEDINKVEIIPDYASHEDYIERLHYLECQSKDAIIYFKQNFSLLQLYGVHNNNRLIDELSKMKDVMPFLEESKIRRNWIKLLDSPRNTGTDFLTICLLCDLHTNARVFSQCSLMNDLRNYNFY